MQTVVCCYWMSANPKMLIKMLSPTVIRIGCFYHCWIQINKANMVHVSNCQISTLNIWNLQRHYLGILDDEKVRHGILTWNYWKYSSHLRRKFGEGKYLFLYHNWENLSLYFILHFCIVLANYKYLPEKRGEENFSLWLYLHLRVTD